MKSLESLPEDRWQEADFLYDIYVEKRESNRKAMVTLLQNDPDLLEIFQTCSYYDKMEERGEFIQDCLMLSDQRFVELKALINTTEADWHAFAMRLVQRIDNKTIHPDSDV